jgi:putative alpha-1,2-mannosidase
MVRIFPITKPGLNDRYLSDRIYGFAVNMPAYRMGYLTELMATCGKVIVNRNDYASMYDHAMEEVHPWYHRVILEDYNITADWTTTERSAIYRFNYSGNDSCNVIFRSSGNSGFKITGSNTVSGWEEFENTRQYFFAEFSRPFDNAGSFHQGIIRYDTVSSGRNSGIFMSFNSSEEPVEVRIGISFIDETQAAANLHKEAGSRSFETIKNESHKIWSAALGKIKVEGKNGKYL